MNLTKQVENQAKLISDEPLKTQNLSLGGSTYQFFKTTEDPSYKRLGLNMEADKSYFRTAADGLKMVQAGMEH